MVEGWWFLRPASQGLTTTGNSEGNFLSITDPLWEPCTCLYCCYLRADPWLVAKGDGYVRMRHFQQVLGKVGSVSGASRAPASSFPMHISGAAKRGQKGVESLNNSPRKHVQLSRQTPAREGRDGQRSKTLFFSHLNSFEVMVDLTKDAPP